MGAGSACSQQVVIGEVGFLLRDVGKEAKQRKEASAKSLNNWKPKQRRLER